MKKHPKYGFISKVPTESPNVELRLLVNIINARNRALRQQVEENDTLVRLIFRLDPILKTLLDKG